MVHLTAMVMGVGLNWLKTNFSRSSELDGNLTKPDGIYTVSDKKEAGDTNTYF